MAKWAEVKQEDDDDDDEETEAITEYECLFDQRKSGCVWVFYWLGERTGRVKLLALCHLRVF